MVAGPARHRFPPPARAGGSGPPGVRRPSGLWPGRMLFMRLNTGLNHHTALAPHKEPEHPTHAALTPAHPRHCGRPRSRDTLLRRRGGHHTTVNRFTFCAPPRRLPPALRGWPRPAPPASRRHWPKTARPGRFAGTAIERARHGNQPILSYSLSRVPPGASVCSMPWTGQPCRSRGFAVLTHFRARCRSCSRRAEPGARALLRGPACTRPDGHG